MENNKQIIVRKATELDFDFICTHITLFDLDNRNLHFNQFVIAEVNTEIGGFGRIRKHVGCDEFCSLGVLEKYRSLGIAEIIIKEKIRLATQPIYLCCIIPHYFETLGFKIVTHFPPQMLDKLNYCNSELVVEEKYVVMRFKK